MSYTKHYLRIEKDGRLTPVVSPLAAADAVGATNFNSKTATAVQKEAWVYQTFQNISGSYDLMNDLESFGLHRAWKHTLVKAVSTQASSLRDILDVASGTGDIAIALAQANPQAQVTGFDFSQNMLDVARKRASASTNSLSNLGFIQGNAMELPFADGSFDAVTISFGLRNMPDYRQVLLEMARVLRPGGRLYCLEASYPTAPVVKPVFRLYFKHLMPTMASIVTGKLAEYRWLNDSTEAFLTKEQLRALMEECGLVAARFRSFSFGAAALHTGTKPA